MFCKYCGTSMPDHVKFCPSCGKPSGVQAGSTGGSPKKPGGPMVHPSGVKPYNPVQSQNAASKTGVKTFNIGNYIFWAGCAMVFISVFLPYLSASALGIGKSVSLMDVRKLLGQFAPESSKYVLAFIVLCLAVSAGLAVVNFFKLNLAALACSATFAAFVATINAGLSDSLSQVSSYTNAASQFLSVFDVNVDVGVKYGIGHTLLLLGSIVMVLSSFAALWLETKRKRTA